MTVYVLRCDHYQETEHPQCSIVCPGEIWGVFATLDLAQRKAEREDRTSFAWRQLTSKQWDNHKDWAIDAFDVQEKVYP